VYGQHQVVPLNHTFHWEYERYLNAYDSIIHTAYQPVFVPWQVMEAFGDSMQTRFPRKKHKRFIGRKMWDEHLIRVRGEDFAIYIDPLLNFQVGRDNQDTVTSTLSTNTRGVQVFGYVTDKVSFYTALYENQSFFPDYLTDFVRANEVVPGQGYVKDFQEDGFDYNQAIGFVRFQATRALDLQLGHGKQFIGNGYRSLLLSDNAFNYPYLRAGVKFWKDRIYYNTSWASLQTLTRTPRINENEATFIRKSANFNYLSFSPTKALEVGLFEGVIWDRWDDSTGTRDFNPQFLVPVMFVNSLLEDDHAQSLLGLTWRYTLNERYTAYGQVVTSNDALGYQVGAKAVDFIGIKGLHLQAEVNSTEAQLYRSESGYTGYDHYGQNLAYVLGENTLEYIGVIHYRWRQVYAQARVNQVYGNPERTLLNGEAGYVINPKYHVNVYGGIQTRTGDIQRDTQWFYIGVRTSLTNHYYDF